jgi:uncharacterized protein (TIRG00374 family)
VSKSEDTKQRRNRIVAWFINLAGVLVFGLILYQGGLETWQQIIQADWRYVLAALTATLLWNMVAAYRWALIARHIAGDTICPYRYFFTYQMLGMLVGQIVPITVGMLGARPVALSLSQGVPLRQSALSVFLDKLFDLTLALLLVVPVALYLVGWLERSVAFALMTGIVVIGAAMIGWQYDQGLQLFGHLASRLAEPVARVPLIGPRLVRRLPQQLDRLSQKAYLPNRPAIQAFMLTLVMYSLLSIRLFFIAQALRLEIPWHLMAMGVPVTQMAVVFAITPGSLGFLEGGWWAVLSLAGLTMEQFYTFVIGRRAFVLVFTLVGTLLAFAWIRESPARLFRAVLVATRSTSQERAEDDGLRTATHR